MHGRQYSSALLAKHRIQPSQTTKNEQASKRSADMSPQQRHLSQLQQSIGNQSLTRLAKAYLANHRQSAKPSVSQTDKQTTSRHEQQPATERDNRMPPMVQEQMEKAFNSDFSDVQIHANSQSAPSIGALAYTQGNEIHFAPGQYDPFSPRGQQLLGHELAHVIQQRQGRVKQPVQMKHSVYINDSESLEREADRMGQKAVQTKVADRELPSQSISAPTPATSKSSKAKPMAGEPIQRLPTRRQLEATLGKPKEHVKNKLHGTWLGKKMNVKENLKENSTRYRNFLDVLGNFNDYVMQTTMGQTAQEIEAQLGQIKQLYDQVDNAAATYIDSKKSGKKVEYIRQLREQLQKERSSLIISSYQHMRAPRGPDLSPKWWLLTSQQEKQVTLKDSMATGESQRGGINSVRFFRNFDKGEGVFKENKDKILSPEQLVNPTKQEESAALNESAIAKDFGIDRNNARLAQRNVAMSRLDQLLGAGVIAKAEMAEYQSPSGEKVLGSFMSKAKGKAAGVLGREGKFVKNAQEKANKPGTIDINDPVLQRSLSRLQLIDTIAMQADRHQGNYFIDFDEDGKVKGVTGIDNDLSFGTREDITKPKNEYAGLSRYVDKELAERILSLKSEDLSLVMADLLTPEEIGAMTNRLNSLKEHLAKLRDNGELLGENDWNEKTAEGMMKEYRSYYGLLKKEVES